MAMKNKDHSEFIALYETLKRTKTWREMNMKNEDFANMLGITDRTLYRYLSGDTTIPRTIIILLRLLLKEQKAIK